MSDPDAFHVVSLGAGVQSTTMLLMALAGELEPRPDAAIFADTGWEPSAVYAHLAWLEGRMQAAGMPLYRVSGGDLRADVLRYAAGASKRGWRIPAYFRSNRQERETMLRRQCTTDYKIKPINRQIKRMLKASGRGRAVVWMGISLDEVQRMKPAREPFLRRRWPLVEARLSRHDCLLWLERHGYPRPPKSACIGCPFHGNDEWRAIRDDPAAWADACAVDAAIRRLPFDPAAEVYLHRSLKPLPMVDLRSQEERGQMSLWDQECEGYCGL